MGFFDIPEIVATVGKAFAILTDRGILIRTGVAFGGIILMLVAVFMMAREPIVGTATKVAKAVI